MTQTFDPKTQNYEPGWYLDPKRCNCDIEFLSWISQQEGYDYSYWRILHMGTGLHHIVGEGINGHSVVGITYSPDELLYYTEMLKKEPILGSHYTVLFGDISVMDLTVLGKFDLVTLFHFGEIGTDVGGYNTRPLNNFRELITNHLKPDARILAYRNSVGFEDSEMLFVNNLKLVEQFMSLNIYVVPE